MACFSVSRKSNICNAFYYIMPLFKGKRNSLPFCDIRYFAKNEHNLLLFVKLCFLRRNIKNSYFLVKTLIKNSRFLLSQSEFSKKVKNLLLIGKHRPFAKLNIKICNILFDLKESTNICIRYVLKERNISKFLSDHVFKNKY